MAYRPRVVANAFIHKAKEKGDNTLSHLKLQKLIFFLHAWNLALHNRPVLDENFEPWPYGPVLPSLYHALKGHGAGTVQHYLPEFDPRSQQVIPLIPSLEDKEFWSLLDQVWDLYSRYSAVDLSNMTHTAGSPWDTARSARALTIDDSVIASYFKDLVARYGSVPSAPATPAAG